MGMAASQVRFLQLTGRKSDIGRQLQSLSLEKMSLSRDMKRVTKEYQEALSSKILKWSNNSGVSYVDLSYDNLMRPSNANANNPYLITDSNGKVVLDKKYQKYAEKFSPNGNPYGDWKSNRSEILSQITGISIDKIENYDNSVKNLNDAANKVNSDQESVDRLKSSCTDNCTRENFIKKCFGNVKYDNKNLYDEYKESLSNSKHSWQLTTGATNSKAIVEGLLDKMTQNVNNYLFDSDLDKFKSAIEATKDIYNDYFTAAEAETKVDDTTTGCPVYQKGGCYYLDFAALINCVFDQYEDAGASTHPGKTDSSITYYETTDKNSDAYNKYSAKLDELQTSKNNYDQSVDTNNQILTASEEALIKFYDKIFSAIAEKGWVADPNVENTDTLNQLLQNNQYYITTMESKIDEKGNNYFEFNSSSASNMDFIYPVNDAAAHNEALTDYEYEKSIINEKESRVDLRMQDLQTEQSAINEMLKSIESVKNDNIERTFSIMS